MLEGLSSPLVHSFTFLIIMVMKMSNHLHNTYQVVGFLVAQLVKNPPTMWETWVWSLGWEDPLEKGKATHSSILAWRIPWIVQSMGSQRVRHDWVTFTFTFKCLLNAWLNPDGKVSGESVAGPLGQGSECPYPAHQTHGLFKRKFKHTKWRG